MEAMALMSLMPQVEPTRPAALWPLYLVVLVDTLGFGLFFPLLPTVPRQLREDRAATK